MKTIFITFIYVVFLIQIGNAQETPIPPTPPSTSSTASSSSNISVRTSGNKGGNVSISISNTEDYYKLKARFPKDRHAELKKLIEGELGGKNLDIKKGYSKWSDDQKVYEIKLTERTLRIFLDTDVASAGLIEKFKDLGSAARTIITGNDGNHEAQEMQREADRMRREADRMKREAQRLERQVKRETEREKKRIEREAQRLERETKREKERMKQEVARMEKEIARNRERIERDAKRIEEEARRLDKQAKRAEREARHKGGVSNMVKKLLDDPKTQYNSSTASQAQNWVWPAAQKALVNSLKKDKLITNEKEITFTMEGGYIYVNGRQLSESQFDKYTRLLQKNGVTEDHDFSFYKNGNNIVLLSLSVDVENFFEDLADKNYISSVNEKVLLNINGSSVYQNGEKLNSDKVAIYNTLLQQNGIIPAPGKFIQIKKPDHFLVGYSIGPKTHIGTWIEK